MTYHRLAVACAIAATVACAHQTLNSYPGEPTVVGAYPFAPVNPGDWPAYNRTLAGDRYSPLQEINTGNVTQLRTVCNYTLPEVTSLQTSPLVVDGVMFFTTDTISYAIDAASCAEKWRKVRHSETPSMLGVNRGFAYADGRLFRGTSDVHVLALDAATGQTLWDRELDVKAKGVSIPMAPIAYNGRVYIGNAGGDIANVTGHVYALDAVDGRLTWKFDVVPAGGPARSTWKNSRLPISGGAFWSSFTLDEGKGILYVPAGNPAPDFDIAVRTGDNLYANSVIAISPRSGRMLAFNQLVKRDAHDWDVDSPPALVTTRSGRQIVASANKDGLLSILDRSRVGHDPNALTSDLRLLSQTPTTTRLNADVPLSRTSSTHFCPGIQGGNEWNGAAYSPQTNFLYTGAVDWCANVQLVGDTTKIPQAGEVWLGAETPQPEIMDPPANARGWVTAFDAENGTVRWKFQSPKPILAAVTPTAGGIVFTADMGGTLYAFDASSGRVLWRTDTGLSTGGGIVTYTAAGRQLIGVAAGMKSPVWPGGASQSRIMVYGLP
jgi:alcohol dehydrogenase (cytochrome c)